MWIQYKLISDEKSRGGSSLVRNYQTSEIYEPDHDFSKVDNQVLLRNLKSLEFEFWDPKKKKWASGLRELNDQKFTLKMVRINLEWLDANKNIYQYSRTFRHLWQAYDAKLDELVYKEEQEAREKLELSKKGKR